MEVERVDGVADYTDLVQPVLSRATARHNLILGLLDVLRRRPDSYQGFHLWAVRDGDRVVGAAIQTPPYNLALARPIDEASIAPLAGAIHDAGVRLPGVVGGLPEAEAFADAWLDLAGGTTETITRQGIYELTAVRDDGHADGRAACRDRGRPRADRRVARRVHRRGGAEVHRRSRPRGPAGFVPRSRRAATGSGRWAGGRSR